MITRNTKGFTALRRRAFTLVEIMVSVAIIGISFVSLYAGITAGVQSIQLARENLRSTQIMVEKMETLRIKSWSQLTNGVDVPPTFTEVFYPLAAASQGITYYGTVQVENFDFNSNYDDQLRRITIQVCWTNHNVPRMRQMQSNVARDGLQNYVF
jgi:prepilin-type N-terminal cleavage/methylation domain-containing protein